MGKKDKGWGLERGEKNCLQVGEEDTTYIVYNKIIIFVSATSYNRII